MKGIQGTIPAKLQVKHVTNTTVNDAKKTLVLLLELSLVEYLHCDNARFFDCPKID